MFAVTSWLGMVGREPAPDPAKALFLQGSIPYLSSYFLHSNIRNVPGYFIRGNISLPDDISQTKINKGEIISYTKRFHLNMHNAMANITGSANQRPNTPCIRLWIDVTIRGLEDSYYALSLRRSR